jgi:Tol biopolymer transport system component
MTRTRIRTVALLAAALLTFAVKPAAQVNPEVALRAAMDTETVKGDLKGAIAQYEKIAKGSNRALAAKALVRMAECYQKLGDAEAQKIYERVVRDYADQAEAVSVARAHLGVTAAAGGVKGDRAVWSGGYVDGFGTISPDGRFLTYTDWDKAADLMLRNLTDGTDRPLTNRGSVSTGQGAEFSVISKDGKKVAYEWFYSGRPDELRVASLAGTEIPESRLILQNDDIESILPMDWSPDGNWIAARLVRKDRVVQIALISAQDGALRILKSTGWNDRTGKIFFSPDGRYLAYSTTNPDAPNQSGIFVMAADGSRETAADLYPRSNQVAGWSPDGKHVLFASDRSGSTGLWAVPVADGKPQGQTMLVRSNIGPTIWSLGTTASGTLYTWKRTGETYIQVSSMDLNAGKIQAPPTGVFQRFIASRGRPQWAPDGQQLAFESCGPGGGGHCSIFIWSLKTNQVREVPHQLNYFQYMSWSPDGRELLVGGSDTKGQRGIYRIDVETGATSLLTETGGGYVQWARDGKSFYYKPAKRGDVLLKRELATGAESELVRVPAGRLFAFSLSPNGHSIAAILIEGSTSSLVVIPLDGNQARSVFHVDAPEQLRSDVPLSWTRDGRAVIVMKSFEKSDNKELWQISIDGNQPRKLDIDADSWGLPGSFSLSPDGSHIAFVATAGKSSLEIWALENVVTALNAKK